MLLDRLDEYLCPVGGDQVVIVEERNRTACRACQTDVERPPTESTSVDPYDDNPVCEVRREGCDQSLDRGDNAGVHGVRQHDDFDVRHGLGGQACQGLFQLTHAASLRAKQNGQRWLW